MFYTLDAEKRPLNVHPLVSCAQWRTQKSSKIPLKFNADEGLKWDCSPGRIGLPKRLLLGIFFIIMGKSDTITI